MNQPRIRDDGGRGPVWADEFEAVARAGASIEHERLEVDAAVNELLGKIADMNCPARGEHFWRCVVQRAYERLGEALRNS